MGYYFVFNGVSWIVSLLTGTSHGYIPVEGKGHSGYVFSSRANVFL